MNKEQKQRKESFEDKFRQCWKEYYSEQEYLWRKRKPLAERIKEIKIVQTEQERG